MRYNPLVEPDYERWLEADEMERNQAVRAYHKRARTKMPYKSTPNVTRPDRFLGTSCWAPLLWTRRRRMF